MAATSSSFFSVERRMWVLALLSTALFIALGARLVDLQVVRHGYYEAVAESQRQRASELTPHRGTIYLSESQDGTNRDIFPVATNQQAWITYAVPRDMDDPQHVADEVAPALYAFRQRQEQRVQDIVQQTGQLRAVNAAEGAETEEAEPAPSAEDAIDVIRHELRQKFDQKTDPYEPIIRPYEVLDDEFQQFLADRNLPGIVLEEVESRVYPEKSLAAHVLGYLGYQEEGRVGRYGVEGHFQDQLAGSLGFLSTESDTSGKYIGVGDRLFEPASDGDDVVLTIDRVVQSFIEQVLADGVERFGAERGTIIVMQPRTGAILGMATFPTFDPNYYYAIRDPRVQLNPAVSEFFEPGSILKPVVMASAIEEGLVSPDTTMVDNGPVRVANYTIDTFDSKHHGRQTMTQILEQSNNVGMVWVGQKLEAELMYDYFRRFGLGERTGIQLEGETQANLPEPDDWNITTVATASFGQGVALTPLQALNAINVLANQGQLREPRIVAEVRHSDGEVTRAVSEPIRQVVSPQTAEQLSAMMVSVIENGVAGLARVPGYYLAGKTGTAQVPDERGKYSPDRKIISFVGYGPVEDPQFSVLIKLDNPSGLSFASGTAAPMFRQVAERLLQYYQIAPSYEPGKQPAFRVSITGEGEGT